ncbi:MAG: hypothetical protein ACRD3W_08300, partial [Terriglobales bacterium]
YELRDRGATVSSHRAKTAFGTVSHDPAASLRGAEGVIICQPLTEYGAIVNTLAPHLVNGQTVCLCNAPVGAALQFKNLMLRRTKELQINVIEIGNLFDCARLEGGVLLISGMREKVSFSGVTRNETRRGLSIANAISEGLVPTSNVIERGLSDVERLLRPVLLLFSLLGGRGRDLGNFASVINPSLTTLITALDADIQALARVYQVVVPTFFETLTHFGGVGWDDADTLSQALISISQKLLDQCVVDRASAPLSGDAVAELLKNDVRETFTLLYDLARLSRTPVPVMSSVIDLTEIVTKADLHKSGRKLSDLGMLGLDLHEIIEVINA